MSDLSKIKKKKGEKLVFEKKRQTASDEGNPGSSSAAQQPLGGDVCSEPFGILHVMQVEKNEIGEAEQKKTAERPSCSQLLPRRAGCCG